MTDSIALLTAGSARSEYTINVDYLRVLGCRDPAMEFAIASGVQVIDLAAGIIA